MRQGSFKPLKRQLIHHQVLRNNVLNGDLAGVGSVQNLGGEIANLQAHLVEVRAGIEQRAAVGFAGR